MKKINETPTSYKPKLSEIAKMSKREVITYPIGEILGILSWREIITNADYVVRSLAPKFII
jgi:hypothetical protein